MNTRTSFFTYWTKRNRDLRSLYRSVSALKKAHFEEQLQRLKRMEYQILQTRTELERKQKIKHQLFEAMRHPSLRIDQKLRYPIQFKQVESRIEKLSVSLQKLTRDYSNESQSLEQQVKLVAQKLRHTPHPDFVRTSTTQKMISHQSLYRQKQSPALSMEW